MTATPDREARSTVRPAAYSPGRIALTAVIVLALMALGLVAGKWQWGRYETKSHALHAQERASGLDVAPLESILSPDAQAPGDADWRKVTVTGPIEADRLVELRGRSVNGTASIQYLAWLHTEQGNTVLINLGWTPRSEPTRPTIPEGWITVTGTVRAFESDNGRPGTRITPAQMGGFDGQVLQVYVMVDSACGDAGCVTGVEAVPLPELSMGPHLSYAMQWWLLLVAAAPVGVWLTVRDARLERERPALASEHPPLEAGQVPDEGRRGSASGAPRRSTKRARPSDEEVEDAL